MSAQAIEPVISQPGVYNIDEQTYFSHPALSCSGAKKLLPPSCPAKFKWERDHGQPPKDVFDFGHAAHKMVLGIGAPLAVVAADDWRTAAAQKARKEAYAAGAIPLLAKDHVHVLAMAEQIKAHPIASRLLDRSNGLPEQSLFGSDQATGVGLRSRLDWLPNPTDGGQLVVPDYKTAVSSEPQAFSRSAATYRYHMQAAFYGDLCLSNGLAEDVTFLFIVQEKTAPYVVSVVELDTEAIAVGRALNRTAIDLYADCLEHDRWPGYTDEVELVSLPAWATYDMDVI